MDLDVYDVLIIGAGLSGLNAARILKDRLPDASIVVIEAMNRAGGRTLTEKIKVFDGENHEDTVDLGGQWVSDSQKDVMEILEKYNIKYYKQSICGSKVLQVGDGKVKSYKSEIPSLPIFALIQMHRLIQESEALCKNVDIRDPFSAPNAEYLDSMSLMSFVQSRTSYKSVHDIFIAAVGACLGCHPSEVSLLFFLAYGNAAGGIMKLLLVEDGAAQQYRVCGGAQQISLKILEEIGKENVVFEEKVTDIIQSSSTAEIRCRSGRVFHARRIISTLPTNQIRRIRFEPQVPPSKLYLMNAAHMGNLAKVYIRYESSFWREKGFSGECVSFVSQKNLDSASSLPLVIVYDATTYKGTPLLVGFFAGETTDEWFNKPDEVRKQAVLKQLASYFGDESLNPFAYYDKNWMTEESIQGGPSTFFAPGSMRNFHHLRQPHGLVHFGGTEMALRWCGYMSGALEAGRKAAAEVIQALHPEALSSDDRNLLDEYFGEKSKERIDPLNTPGTFSTFKGSLLFLTLLITFVAFVIRVYIEYGNWNFY